MYIGTISQSEIEKLANEIKNEIIAMDGKPNKEWRLSISANGNVRVQVVFQDFVGMEDIHEKYL